MRLIIIGNGFDLAHGLKTKFSDFKEFQGNSGKNQFVKKIDSMLEINGYDINNDYEWNKLEEILYEEYKRLKNRINRESLTKDLDEFSTYFHNYLITQILPKTKKLPLIQNVKKYFTGDVFILNFNYTNLYKNYMDITSEKVFHIHGDLEDEENNNIIIGYFIDYYERSSSVNYKEKFADKEVCKATNTYKYRDKSLNNEVGRVKDIIRNKIDEIVVLGYSFGESDNHLFSILEESLISSAKEEIIPRSVFEQKKKIKLTIFDYNNDSEEKKRKLITGLESRKLKFDVLVTGYPGEYSGVKKELIEYSLEKYI